MTSSNTATPDPAWTEEDILDDDSFVEEENADGPPDNLCGCEDDDDV